MVYNSVIDLSATYGVREICRVLNVSFSAYYAYKRGESRVLHSEKSERAEKVSGDDEHIVSGVSEKT